MLDKDFASAAGAPQPNRFCNNSANVFGARLEIVKSFAQSPDISLLRAEERAAKRGEDNVFRECLLLFSTRETTCRMLFHGCRFHRTLPPYPFGRES